MTDEVRSGLIRRFLTPGDEIERPGQIEPGQVGIDLGGGIEIIDTRANLLKFAREIFERFSGRAFPDGMANPYVVVVGNPVDGFEHFGPTPLDDTPDGYQHIRLRMLEETGEDPFFLVPLKPMPSLRPLDGHDEPAQRAGTLNDLLDEFEGTELDDDAVDELVHDVAGRRAADINNDGRVEQFAYLIERLGYPGAQHTLRDLIA